ncbi:unnamed protein product [Chrysoparadoxa australica]
MKDCAVIDTPAVASKKLESNNGEMMMYQNGISYRTVVGALLWLSTSCRPDITSAVRQVSQHVTNPGKEHWQAAKRILRYLHGTAAMGITYHRSTTQELPAIHAHADADYAGDTETRKSVSGGVIYLAGGAIAWLSRKQSLVTLSSTESELVALTEVSKTVLWLRQVGSQMGFSTAATWLGEDNQSALFISSNQASIKRSRHIDIRFHWVRQEVELEHIQLYYLQSDRNTADALTKQLDRDLLHKHRMSMMGMGSPPEAPYHGPDWDNHMQDRVIGQVFVTTGEVYAGEHPTRYPWSGLVPDCDLPRRRGTKGGERNAVTRSSGENRSSTGSTNTCNATYTVQNHPVYPHNQAPRMENMSYNLCDALEVTTGALTEATKSLNGVKLFIAKEEEYYAIRSTIQDLVEDSKELREKAETLRVNAIAYAAEKQVQKMLRNLHQASDGFLQEVMLMGMEYVYDKNHGIADDVIRRWSNQLGANNDDHGQSDTNTDSDDEVINNQAIEVSDSDNNEEPQVIGVKRARRD